MAARMADGDVRALLCLFADARVTDNGRVSAQNRRRTLRISDITQYGGDKNPGDEGRRTRRIMSLQPVRSSTPRASLGVFFFVARQREAPGETRLRVSPPPSPRLLTTRPESLISHAFSVFPCERARACGHVRSRLRVSKGDSDAPIHSRGSTRSPMRLSIVMQIRACNRARV